jgi:hypothetical protein
MEGELTEKTISVGLSSSSKRKDEYFQPGYGVTHTTLHLAPHFQDPQKMALEARCESKSCRESEMNRQISQEPPM